MNTRLSLYNISKKFYARHGEVVVFDSLSVDFYQGRSYALNGPSGSGKSTLLHILAGIEAPCSGKVLYKGENLNFFTKKDKQYFLHNDIGMIFQTPLLVPELTVLENILFKDLIIKYPSTEKIKRGLELLAELHLEDKAYAFPHLLSGGQAQRVAFGRALYNKPAFILADEPLAHLDRDNQKIILAMLKRSQIEWGMGVVLSSHTKEIIESMDSIYTLGLEG